MSDRSSKKITGRQPKIATDVFSVDKDDVADALDALDQSIHMARPIPTALIERMIELTKDIDIDLDEPIHGSVVIS